MNCPSCADIKSNAVAIQTTTFEDETGAFYQLVFWLSFDFTGTAAELHLCGERVVGEIVDKHFLMQKLYFS